MASSELTPKPSPEYDVPEGWDRATLDTVVKVPKRSLDPRSFPDEVFEYYSIPAYQAGGTPIQQRGSAIGSQKLLVEPGTVLFGKLNPRVPKVWRVTSSSPQRKIASTEFIPLEPIDGQVDGEFLFYLSWSEGVMGKAKGLVSGSTPSRQRVDPRGFLALSFLRPPLEEQRSIAGILRAVQEAKEATEKVIVATRELRRSLMRHLFTYGPVSLEAAETVDVQETTIGLAPAHWSVVELSQLVTQAQYGLSLRGERTGPYPILRMNNLNRGRIEIQDLQYVDIDASTLGKFKLRKGDLLFNRTNSYELVGKTALFKQPGDWVFASYLIRVEVDAERASPEYLNYYLNWEVSQARLRMLATRGVSQSNISATKLKTFRIVLPPLQEQMRIADMLSAVDAKIEVETTRRDALDQLLMSTLAALVGGKRRVADLETARA